MIQPVCIIGKKKQTNKPVAVEVSLLDREEQVYRDIQIQHFVSLPHSSHCLRTAVS